MAKADPIFTLQFAPSEIGALANYSVTEDSAPLEAGANISKGDFSRRNLETIFNWKTKGRGKSRLAKNTDGEIADALRLSVEAKTPRAAISVLTGLSGVDIPVASAILSVVSPSRYTIIDWRVMQALGLPARSGLTLKMYLAYLEKCHNIASENGVTLRELDRAMWRWSKERGVPR